MPADNSNRSHLCAWAAMLLAVVSSGCALLLKGTTTRVDVVGPRDATFHRLEHGLDSVPLALVVAPDGVRRLDLPSSDSHTVIARTAAGADTVRLIPSLNGWYLAGDIPLVWGLLIDGVTGAWYDFDGAAIAYQPDSSHAAPPHWRLVFPGRDRPAGRRLGITVSGYWGAAAPVVQVPLFGNHLGVGVAWRALPQLDVAAGYRYNGCVDLVDPRGDARVFTGECSLTMQVVDLGARYYPADWLIATASLGAMRVEGSNVETSAGAGRTPYAFGAWLPAFDIGGGVRWGIASLELHQMFGLGRITVYSDGSSARASVTSILLGVHVGL